MTTPFMMYLPTNVCSPTTYVYICSPTKVAGGVDRLHTSSPPLVHGDLKAGNVLLEDDGMGAVVCDFGCSTEQQGAGGGTVGLTVSISPPEVLTHPRAPRGPAVDVYAFGILLLEMVTGLPAFQRLTATQVMQVVMRGQRPHIPPHVQPEVAAIICDCWAQQPSQRPSMGQVVQRLHGVVQSLAAAHTLNTTALPHGDTTVTREVW